MASNRRGIFRDAGTKFLALIMALAVYLHVFSAQEREMTYRIPLRITPPPSGLLFAGDVPGEVRVRVHASGKDLLKLRTRRFAAEVKLDASRAGSLQRPLLGSDVTLPQGVRARSIEILEPQALNLQIEPAATAMVPVAVRLKGSLPEDRALVQIPVPEPDRVRATGPKSAIATLDSLATEPVSMEGWRGDHQREVSLITPRSVTAEPGRIRLSIEVEERATRESRLLPVEVIAPSWSRVIAVDPDSAWVLLSGAISALQRADLGSARIVADLHRLGRNPRAARLRALVPGLGIGTAVIVRCSPESVRVVVR